MDQQSHHTLLSCANIEGDGHFPVRVADQHEIDSPVTK